MCGALLGFYPEGEFISYSDPVDVLSHDALVVEAGGLHFRFYWISEQVFQ
jgi:hypothetical protein